VIQRDGGAAGRPFLVGTARRATRELKVALTFDDLPLNGSCRRRKQSDFARDTVAVLKKHRIPPSYGFINAASSSAIRRRAALQIWVDGGIPLANHTYSHLDLTKNSVEDFQREILRNEPVLELLMPPKAVRQHDWRWFRYPYLHEGDTLEKRRAVRAFLAATVIASRRPRSTSGDYLWNSAHARCVLKKDESPSRGCARVIAGRARVHRAASRNSRAVFGRDITT
jgi:peptidoglycan/xylan/chitin deacetylase (PgdA/CDA1 family)